MKIFSKEQIYQGDKLTAERQGISSDDLMERAGTQIFNWLHARMQGAQVPVHVFCGIGNNGGDGLVLARHLITHGYNAITYVVNCSDKRSKDFLVNYDRIKTVTKEWPNMLTCKEDFPAIHKDDIIVDAVFGIGLNRSIDDWVKQLFIHFRQSQAFTLSIDVPSGLFVDKYTSDKDAVVHANHTLSFASPKLVFFLEETAYSTQQWEILDIGLDQEYLFTTQTECELIGKYEVIPIYRPRKKYQHKGDFGHALIVGGSRGKMGAAILTTRAALTMGAGLVTSHIPNSGNYILQISVPEAMVTLDAEDHMVSNIDYNNRYAAVGIGVGMGKDKKSKTALEAFLKECKSPLVIDADALNIISENQELLTLVPKESILTPHTKELERLVGPWKNDFDKLDKAKAFVNKHEIILILKGANTITFFKDKLFINSSGNPGMATAGSGDVLTGILVGLLSQGYDAVASSIFGVYLHGRAGDFGVQDLGYEGLLASDIITYIGEAIQDLFKRPEQQPQTENAQQE